MPIIGAHVSAAVELSLSFERASHIGAKATQIFISPPQQWVQTQHSYEEIKQYLDKQQTLGIGPNFIHGTYLINLAAEDPLHLQKSIDWLKYALREADKMGVTGVIFHPGSHKGRGFDAVVNQLTNAVDDILSQPGKSFLVLENCAGSGGVIGGFTELGQIFKQVESNRLKVCLDTQHAFAQGHDLSNKKGVEELLEEIDETVSLKNLVVIHANDSKVKVGTNKDRHENIGDGYIGKKGFKEMLNHPKLNDIPFILEVPGFSDNGPDRENIDILKSLLNN